MISCSSEAMTPKNSQCDRYVKASYFWLTEGMPQNQGQLRHLLALFTQLQKCSLPRRGFHQFGNPPKHSLVLLRHAHLSADLVDVGCRTARNRISAWNACSIVARIYDTIVLVLLSDRGGGGSGSGLSLDLLLLHMVGRMVIRVLMVTLRPLGGELLRVHEVLLHLVEVVECRE
jgi:hypothetical protein